MSKNRITEAELAEAWKRLHFDESFLANILADIEAHREPEYVPGAAYQDATGKTWEYHPGVDDGGCPWRAIGTASAFSAGTPKRPLRRLIPEEAGDGR